MVNGYALPRPGGLAAASARIAALDAPARDHLRGLLSVGIPAETEVTLNRAGHRVTQAQCSALPAAYGSDPVDAWEPPARLVLEAAHEATFLAALRFGRPARPLFLTLPA